MLAVPKSAVSESQVKKAVAGVPTPVGVKLRKVFFDIDQTGDDAVYAIFSMAKKPDLRPSRIGSLVEFKTRVGREIDSLELGRLPYVRFVDAR